MATMLTATTVGESESASLGSTLANPSDNDEGARSSLGGEEGETLVAPLSAVGGVEGGVEEADEARVSLVAHDRPEGSEDFEKGGGCLEVAERPSLSTHLPEQDGAEDSKQSGTAKHLGKDLPPHEDDPLTTASYGQIDSSIHDSQLIRVPSDGSFPFLAEAGGHMDVDEELQQPQVVPMLQEPWETHSRPAAQEEEQEMHDDDSPSVLDTGDPLTARVMDSIHLSEPMATEPTPRERVGAFRNYPEQRRIENAGCSLETQDDSPPARAAPPVSQGNNHDDDLESGAMNNTNIWGDATVVPIPQASLVDDHVVEGYPIHLTHVPISDNTQQQHDESEANNGVESETQKVFKKISWGLLIICGVTAAVAAALNLGNKDKGNILGSQTEEEEVSSTNGEDEERVKSIDDLVSSPEEQMSLIASPDAETATGQTSTSSNTTTFAHTTTLAPTEAEDLSPMVWEQVGSTIPGVSTRDRTGFSVASSKDGKIIAIGSQFNNDVASQAGHVRIFAWNHSANDWVQRGSTLFGEAEGDRFGYSVALSGSGDIVACGAPHHVVTALGLVKVFKWNETLADYAVWGSLHNHKRYAWEQWGWEVDLSEDGLRVALGAPREDCPVGCPGVAWVFEWNDVVMDWAVMGNESILGEQTGDFFGHSTSLSADGETLAVGAIMHNSTSGEAEVGKTRVLKWDDAMSDWAQIGNGIYGEAAGDWSGFMNDISADGKTLAISALRNNGANGENSGHVRVYFWDELISDWAQLGSDIDGKDEFDQFGAQVSLTDDGRTVAITSVLNSNNAGHCRVFQWNDDLQDWIQLGQDIRGEAGDKTRGVALSGDGRIVVVGAWGVLSSTGHVRVFNHNQWEGGKHDVFQ